MPLDSQSLAPELEIPTKEYLAVVGEDASYGDSVTAEECDRPLEKGNRGCGLLVPIGFRKGQPARVVHRHEGVLPSPTAAMASVALIR